MNKLAPVLTFVVSSVAFAVSCSENAVDGEPATGGSATGGTSSGGSTTGGSATGGSATGGSTIGGAGGMGGMGGMGGSGSHTLKQTHGAIETLVLGVNFGDGFLGYEQQTYRVDVASRMISFEHVAHGPGFGGAGGIGNVDEQSEFEASDAQMATLLLAVGNAEWREQTSCLGLAIDGAPYPPRLEVVGARSDGTYGVSDAKCGESDHSAYGPIISCAAYSDILAALLDVVPDGTDQSCQSYW